MSERRILITGGNGYVGLPLTRLLMAQGEVCVVDALLQRDWQFDAAERKRLRLEQIDIRDGAAITRLMADFAPAVIVHLAAIHYIPACEADPADAVSTNVAGTLNLLAAAPPGSRFVFASSGAVYRPAEEPHCEVDSALAPDDIYGFTKLHGEHYIAAMARKRSLAAVVVRLFNVVGPGETNPHLLPELVAQLKAGRRVIELGNLSPRRDYIHVTDAARGFAATALRGELAAGEVRTVNLGTGTTHSVEDVVTKLRLVSGVPFAIRQDSSRIRPVDRPNLAARNARIAAQFGWSPSRTIDDALGDLWINPQLSPNLLAKYG